MSRYDLVTVTPPARPTYKQINYLPKTQQGIMFSLACWQHIFFKLISNSSFLTPGAYLRCKWDSAFARPITMVSQILGIMRRINLSRTKLCLSWWNTIKFRGPTYKFFNFSSGSLWYNTLLAYLNTPLSDTALYGQKNYLPWTSEFRTVLMENTYRWKLNHSHLWAIHISCFVERCSGSNHFI